MAQVLRQHRDCPQVGLLVLTGEFSAWSQTGRSGSVHSQKQDGKGWVSGRTCNLPENHRVLGFSSPVYVCVFIHPGILQARDRC